MFYPSLFDKLLFVRITYWEFMFFSYLMKVLPTILKTITHCHECCNYFFPVCQTPLNSIMVSAFAFYPEEVALHLELR